MRNVRFNTCVRDSPDATVDKLMNDYCSEDLSDNRCTLTVRHSQDVESGYIIVRAFLMAVSTLSCASASKSWRRTFSLAFRSKPSMVSAARASS